MTSNFRLENEDGLDFDETHDLEKDFAMPEKKRVNLEDTAEIEPATKTGDPDEFFNDTSKFLGDRKKPEIDLDKIHDELMEEEPESPTESLFDEE